MTQTYKLTIEEICNKLRPVFGKKIDEIYLRYAMAGSREEREEIEHILNALYQRNLSELLDKGVLLEPPVKEEVEGEYPLGTVSYAGKRLDIFNLREQDWMRHVCITGMSGSGKTTLGFHIIENFIKKEKPFLIFDWKKSFRPLMALDGNIMNFTIGDDSISNLFKLNINRPPKGIAPKEWINVLCDLITESFSASYGVHKVLLETLDDAFKEHGVYNGSDNYPTWNYIKWRLETKIKKTKGREATWLESALRIAHVLTFGSFGKVLNYKGNESLDIADLFDKKVIFELNSLGNIEKKFFCEFVLTYIYKLKKSKQNRVEGKFDYAILVDEAHNVFLKDKTNFVKESVTDMIYREMREYGVSLICLDQHVSKISDTVTGNSACHIAFQQQLPQDIWSISGLMQLNEKRHLFSQLPVGSAIVKLSERYTNPFLIEVEPANLRKKDVSDKELKQKMSFIFESKKIHEGLDEFSVAVRGHMDSIEEKSKTVERMMDRVVSDRETKEEYEEISKSEQWPVKEEKARVPKHALYNGEYEEVKELKKDKPVLIIGNDKDNVVINELTPVQKILNEFVQEKVNCGWDMVRIERILNNHKIEGRYSNEDIFKAIDYSIAKRLKVSNSLHSSIPWDNTVSVTTEEKQNVYKPQKTGYSELDNVQERFIAFLRENPGHELSTVEVYKKLGLSPRKGNKIKDELMAKNLIIIKEQKYEKGWKKLIRLHIQ